MMLRYKRQDGSQMEFELGERPITIGRGTEADLVILDEKASRLHCGIRLWDGDFYIKDLKSRNGTFVNGQPVEMAKLNPGDVIRVGGFSFSFDTETSPKGSQTILQEVADEMSRGKGYTTLLKEIVNSAQPPPAADTAEPAPVAESEAKKPVRKLTLPPKHVKKTVKVTIRKPAGPPPE